MTGFWRRVLGMDGTDDPRIQRRDWSISDPALAEFFNIGGETLAGVKVDESSTLGLTAVYRAVSIIAGTVAGLPLRSLRTLADDTRERVPSFLDDPSGPGGPYTQFEWTELVMVHLLLHGNAFLQHVYNGGGAIVGLNPIPPAAVTIRQVRTDEDRERFAGYPKWFEIRLADNQTVELTPADLTHIPALGTDGLRGLSPIEAHRQALGTGIAGDRAAARLFGSGLLLAGLVSGDEDMDQAEAAEASAALKAKMAGASHAGEFAFVNARLKFTPWSIPPVDAQFIESRAHQIEEVARIFGIPPHLLGQTEKQTSWGTGVAEQNRGLSTFTLKPWTSRVEQRLSRLLSRPTKAEFDYSGLLQPAPEVEIPLLIAQVQAGLLTLDEARRVRNLPPLPAGPAPGPDPAEADAASSAGAGAR